MTNMPARLLIDPCTTCNVMYEANSFLWANDDLPLGDLLHKYVADLPFLFKITSAPCSGDGIGEAFRAEQMYWLHGVAGEAASFSQSLDLDATEGGNSQDTDVILVVFRLSPDGLQKSPVLLPVQVPILAAITRGMVHRPWEAYTSLLATFGRCADECCRAEGLWPRPESATDKDYEQLNEDGYFGEQAIRTSRVYDRLPVADERTSGTRLPINSDRTAPHTSQSQSDSRLTGSVFSEASAGHQHVRRVDTGTPLGASSCHNAAPKVPPRPPKCLSRSAHAHRERADIDRRPNSTGFDAPNTPVHLHGLGRSPSACDSETGSHRKELQPASLGHVRQSTSRSPHSGDKPQLPPRQRTERQKVSHNGGGVNGFGQNATPRLSALTRMSAIDEDNSSPPPKATSSVVHKLTKSQTFPAPAEKPNASRYHDYGHQAHSEAGVSANACDVTPGTGLVRQCTKARAPPRTEFWVPPGLKMKLKHSVSDVSSDATVCRSSESDVTRPRPQPRARRPPISRVADIPEDISTLTLREVSDCLKLLVLERHVEKFRQEFVDGPRLITLSEEILREEFGLTSLEAKKLHLFATTRWRPS